MNQTCKSGLISCVDSRGCRSFLVDHNFQKVAKLVIIVSFKLEIECQALTFLGNLICP